MSAEEQGVNVGRFEVLQINQVGNPALLSSCSLIPLPIDDDANRAVIDFRPLCILSTLFLEMKRSLDGAR